MPSYTKKTLRPPLLDHITQSLDKGKMHLGDQFLTTETLYGGSRDIQF